MCPPRTGFVTFEGMGYEEPIAKAAEFGFDFVEVMLPYVARDALGREFIEDNAAAIRSALEEHGVDLLVHLPHRIDIGSGSEILRAAGVEEIEACVRAAVEVGAEKGVFHPETAASRRAWSDDAIRSRLLESISEVDEFADRRGFELCMENVPGSRFSIREFDAFFERTDCSMTLDTGHARVSGMDSAEIAGFVDDHAERISHVHLNDNKAFVAGEGRPPADDHVPTGSGDLDLGALLSAFERRDWDGTVSLEVQTKNFDYVEFSLRQLESAARAESAQDL